MLATSSSQTITDWAEVDSVNLGGAHSTIDRLMTELTRDYRKIMGGMFSSSTDVDLSTAGGTATLQSMMLNTANPLAELSAIGHRMISGALDIFKKMDECTYSADTYNEAFKKGAIHGTGEMDRSQCTGQAKGFLGSYFISAVLSALIAAGVTLGYMLPLLPFIRFMFGILSWILALLETVIAIPVVALAHIKMDGEGLSGPMARGAYLLLLQLFLRPTLMVFGLISALLIFNFMIVALNEFYTQAVAGATDSGSLGGIALVIYSVIYASLAYAFANASFKAIDMIPNQVLLWIGGPQGQTIDESHRVTGAVGQAASAGGSAVNAHQLANNAGGSARFGGGQQPGQPGVNGPTPY
jgi:conjugal transfer/type IV secretion protein DotA/TraY